MPQKIDIENERYKAIVRIAAFVALVAIVWIDALNTDSFRELELIIVSGIFGSELRTQLQKIKQKKR